MTNMLEKAKSIENYIINFRRDLHKYPEVSGQEFKTQEKLMKELDKIGIPYKKAGNTSLIAILKGSSSGKTVALRADIDALPIKEESDVEFKSKNTGVMHACGHDTHTAMLLGAVNILNEMKEDIKGEIRFFFQEGEETFTGAKKIIEAGGMSGVDGCFGIHNFPNIETGYIDVTSGYRSAGCDTIYVKFEGVSGHGSTPHLAKDTIHPASIFVTNLQGIVTKNVPPQEPVVLSVGKFIGGTKANIIAKYTELDISMRYFNREVRETVHETIKRHAKAIADAYEINVDVVIEESALSVYNNETMSKLAEKTALSILGENKIVSLPKMMGSEDMSYYFEHAKGAFVWLGSGNVEKECIYHPHHEKFKVDEDYLKYGMAMYAQFALDFLNSNI